VVRPADGEEDTVGGGADVLGGPEEQPVTTTPSSTAPSRARRMGCWLTTRLSGRSGRGRHRTAGT
jgi:hypothetical protein